MEKCSISGLGTDIIAALWEEGALCSHQVQGVRMKNRDKQFERIDSIIGVGDNATSEDALDKFYEYLRGVLRLPCEVTGIEDFDWEEPYVFGARDLKEYERLRRERPSYEDIFELLDIQKDRISEWMLFPGRDLVAHVRRMSDGKEFYLGLAELKAVDKRSPNYQPLNDYAVWLVNSE